MTDAIRDLLISLAAHMAYMQDRLEEGRALEDPEDYYWCRESVLLRQKVTDALADEPAVPEGREPAAVIGEPSDRRPTVMEIIELSSKIEAAELGQVDFARAVLARWGNPAPLPPAKRWGNPAPKPPAKGEVAELVQHLHHAAEVDDWEGASPEWCQSTLRAAELLQRLSPPQPVPVSERLPVAEDCDAEGRCWVWWKNGVRWVLDEWTHHELREGRLSDCVSHWLPAHALPLPEVE